VTPLNPKHEPAGRNKRKSTLPKRPPPKRNGHKAGFDNPMCDERFFDAHDDDGTLIDDNAGDRFKKTKRLTSTCRKDVCETADKTNDKPQVLFTDRRLVRKSSVKIGRAGDKSCHERKTIMEEEVVQKVVGLSR